jgi:hypothetical protein
VSPPATNAASHSASATSARTSQSWLWIGAAALVGFLVGFGAQYSRLGRAQQEARYANHALHAARLEATLSGAVIDAQSGRYEVARRQASDFYTGLQRRLLPVMPAAQQEEARIMLAERDSIITSLARSDPLSSGTLSSVLVRLRETVRRADLDSTATQNGAVNER